MRKIINSVQGLCTLKTLIWHRVGSMFGEASGVDRKSLLKRRLEIEPWTSNLLWLNYCANI